MSTWPFSWLAMTALVLAIVLIVTCSPWRAKSPSFCAMYSPARSAEGMAATVTFRSPGLVSAASPASRCAAAHPASIMITAAASAAARTCPVFIFAPPGIAADPGLTSRCYQRAGRAAARLLIRDPFVPRSCRIRPHCEQNGEPDAPRLPPLTCLRRLGQDLEPPGLRRPPQLGGRRGEPRGDSSRVMTGPACSVEDRSRDNG